MTVKSPKEFICDTCEVMAGENCVRKSGAEITADLLQHANRIYKAEATGWKAYSVQMEERAREASLAQEDARAKRMTEQAAKDVRETRIQAVLMGIKILRDVMRLSQAEIDRKIAEAFVDNNLDN